MSSNVFYRVTLTPQQLFFIEDLLSKKRDKAFYAGACCHSSLKNEIYFEYFDKEIKMIDSIFSKFNEFETLEF